jgi:hypothetical protein
MGPDATVIARRHGLLGLLTTRDEVRKLWRTAAVSILDVVDSSVFLLR